MGIRNWAWYVIFCTGSTPRNTYADDVNKTHKCHKDSTRLQKLKKNIEKTTIERQ